ncbi:ero1-like protein [Neodiprion pinetum]|uniref:Ero1-like protein n=1 Tax=Neodiprion lecontei TaxID=441921 RepID=A0A6J0B838_NEOLC|nr:ero1-like protein [Neodiprion lecontei]XP_046428814.1 ero1-like protein [Neodiprion fabricii]XP_046484919.1 ero1-like protein [Neodiprion pinetum]
MWLSNSVIVILFLFPTFGVDANYFGTSNDNDDQCFCKLKGSIDDCSCSVDTVDHFNNMKIYPRLRSLLVKDYFRFYKVNLKQECPFWSDDSRCAIRYCHVEPCQDEDIPAGLKGDVSRHNHYNENPADKYSAPRPLEDCERSSQDYNKELGYLNTTISVKNYEEFEMWQKHDDAVDNFCVSETSPGEYVDLLLNPERYTGYRGPSAHRIWRSIYMENCFRPEKSTRNFVQSKMNGMCLEKRVFYRVVSGLHSSINIHLCSKYLLSEKDSLETVSAGAQWGPNLSELQRRFSPETTGGEGPTWLKNLYFIYLLELRALAKAAPYLLREEYYTGNDEDDRDTRLAVHDFLNVVRSFPDHFNESVMFNGGAQDKALKEEFRQHFRNISRIMDCVGCDKCKLWGKLQIHGLGTALKILFSGKFDRWEPTLDDITKQQFYLERSEIVALINAFGRLSDSVFELEMFRQMMR